ncbi:ABC transporter ATP-binding protein [Alkalihalobacillus sp. LMS39]|uniref:ABC transporter ATP-binding protein n=1 Tax=Alkalihalobacillus sp. LMS39 TaxID=2924032 RepID=UPI001FB2AB0A|nr:ABC transporter ATP-binding protein [Alkalihalobacillus sp. LMS39]UOE96388.1 ABC transporter ATP-binding protein [Alkalihalobacillus sp. LMS39]
MIEVHELTRDYIVKKKGKKEVKQALKGVSFHVNEGEIFGLLGPNGAGKTTTIKVLTSLLTPTSGTVTILDHDVRKDGDEIRKHINFMFGGDKGIYGRLTAWEYLKYFACLYKVSRKEQNERIANLLELVELTHKKDDKLYTFSKGMTQRIHIARSLINNPKLLFLDEPTIGLDPVVAESMRELILGLSKKQISIILTTHYMKEADELCDRIGIINEGEIKKIGSPKQLKECFSHLRIFETSLKLSDKNSLNDHSVFTNIKQKHIQDNVYILRFEVHSLVSFEQVQQLLSDIGEVLTLDQKEITLEDAYIHIIKGEES